MLVQWIEDCSVSGRRLVRTLLTQYSHVVFIVYRSFFLRKTNNF